MIKQYKICARCVMDITYPDFYVDETGLCNYCNYFEKVTKKRWFPNEEGASKFKLLLEQIKVAGAKQPYDCIIGLSGGVDSSYLAVKAKAWGLRPLVMHVDAGWNSELAVANIEQVVKYGDYHLHTHVVDWEEMRDLQLAYLRAGVANQDVPQDHAFAASLYHYANKYGIRYILSGGNIATEGISLGLWYGEALDAKNLRAIYQKYGNGQLKQYKTVSFFQYYLYYPFVKGMRIIRPLNFMPYDREGAITELETNVGWRSYGRKHDESIFTRFFQCYYLPVKFGYDLRRLYLSSQIVSGQLMRDEVMVMLEKPLYESEEMERDISYFCKKLHITRDDFDDLMSTPNRHYSDFKNADAFYLFVKKMQSFISRITKHQVHIYS